MMSTALGFQINKNLTIGEGLMNKLPEEELKIIEVLFGKEVRLRLENQRREHEKDAVIPIVPLIRPGNVLRNNRRGNSSY